MKTILAAAFCFSLSAFANDFKLAKAIHKVETSGRLGRIVGDHGKAIGPLQIHYSNWKDAVEFDKSIGGKYVDCFKLDYSYRIFYAYMNKYALNKTTQEKARIWNGGPKGDSKFATLVYWNKVKKFI